MKPHKGFVDAESKPGQGARFSLFFPATKRQSGFDVKRSHQTSASVHSSETILLVDDEAQLLELLRVSLQREGYHVSTAMTGAEAQRLFEEYRDEIDLVISDLGLPKMDGSTLLSVLKRSNPDVNVILESGYLEPGLKEELLKRGASAVIQKPCTAGTMLEIVREVLDRR